MKFFPPILVLVLLLMRLDNTTAALTVIRTWVPALPKLDVCDKEAVVAPELYIEQVHGYFLLRRCTSGSRFSTVACGCVMPIPIPRATTTTTELTTTPIISTDTTTDIENVVDFATISRQRNDDFCGPSFRFIFNRTTMSDDRSVPSQASNTARFVQLPGSVGETSLLLGEDGFVTVWTMSYITFAYRFKFMLRFKLQEDYEYMDQPYNLFADGPCGNYTPKYSIIINPVKREVNANITLRNRANVNLTLEDVNVNEWMVLELEAKNGQIRLVIDNREIMGYIGASTIKSSPCPMEVGKPSQTAAGFVGYIDVLAFHNCFGN